MARRTVTQDCERLLGDIKDLQNILFGNPGNCCHHGNAAWEERVRIAYILEAIIAQKYRRSTQ